MSLILNLRAQRSKAIAALGAEEAINSEAVTKQLEAEITEIDAKLARANKAQQRAADLARPAGAHAEAESQSDVEGFEFDSGPVADHVERLADLRAEKRGVASMRAAYDSVTERFFSGFERSLRDVCRSSIIIPPPREKRFATLGEQLVAIRNYYMSGKDVNAMDSRLVRAPSGAGEVDATGGGFLVQTDFAAALYMEAHKLGDILGAVNKIPIGDKFSGIKMPAVDETSRATGSRWGGVQSYWLGEGTAPTPSKIKTKLLEWSLHKLVSLYYITDELLADAGALTAVMAQAFSEEIAFMTEDAIWEGSGSGMPLGILKDANSASGVSTALLSTLSNYGSSTDPAAFAGSTLVIPSVKGQPSGSVIKQNIDQMWARVPPAARSGGAWWINKDVEPYLLNLNQQIGTGGQGGTLVYMPPGGMSVSPYAMLYGRPVIPIEYAPGAGNIGDIMFGNFDNYTLADKGGIQFATSMHVAFLTDEMTFRVTYRVDGKPMRTVPRQPFAKGSLYDSHFVALAPR